MTTSAHFPLSEEEDRKEAAAFRREFFGTMVVVGAISLDLVVAGFIVGVKLGLI